MKYGGELNVKSRMASIRETGSSNRKTTIHDTMGSPEWGVVLNYNSPGFIEVDRGGTHTSNLLRRLLLAIPGKCGLTDDPIVSFGSRRPKEGNRKKRGTWCQKQKGSNRFKDPFSH